MLDVDLADLLIDKSLNGLSNQVEQEEKYEYNKYRALIQIKNYNQLIWMKWTTNRNSYKIDNIFTNHKW